MTPEQLDYVKKILAAGTDVEVLKSTLRKNGYSEDLIVQLITAAQGQTQQEFPAASTLSPIPTPETKKKFSVVRVLVAVVGVLVLLGFIGISIIGSSLNSARDKGQDAATKQTLSTARAQAEIYFNTSSYGYLGFCESEYAKKLFSSVEAEVECLDSETKYRFISQLSDGTFQCVVMESYSDEEFFMDFVTIAGYPVGFLCE